MQVLPESELAVRIERGRSNLRVVASSRPPTPPTHGFVVEVTFSGGPEGIWFRDISKLWTVSLLARAVGLSRPAFARQFVHIVQLSPMRYLTRRRMQLAADLLRDSDAGLAEIAAQVGYQSEFAFGRAFKRHHQVSPGVYRRQPSSARASAMGIAA
jgi:AraC-like DNA-binding protein